MRSRWILLAGVVFIMGLQGCIHKEADTSTNQTEEGVAEKRPARSFVAGDTVPAEYLRSKADTASFFRIEPFVATTKQRPELGVAPDSLRRLMCLHTDAEGLNLVGEIVVHCRIAETVLGILRSLHAAHYPIERMVPTDRYDYDDERSMTANNTSAYCPRRVAGTKSLSKHAMGLAIDINPLYNPLVRTRDKGGTMVSPAAGKPYANRSKEFTYKLEPGDLCHKLFKEAGFSWGGDWRTQKDYQHFEMKRTKK